MKEVSDINVLGQERSFLSRLVFHLSIPGSKLGDHSPYNKEKERNQRNLFVQRQPTSFPSLRQPESAMRKNFKTIGDFIRVECNFFIFESKQNVFSFP